MTAAQPMPTNHGTDRPSLGRDPSFFGITGTQFLGAFNDNLYKQLMLLLAIPAAPGVPDQQHVATIVFCLPFVLFSGIAGYLSDRYSKTIVIRWAKSAEIAIMLLGLVGFLGFQRTGYTGLLVVLFLMGTHSAFFGPGKYGILPELFRFEDLPRANGIVLMTTFLAIIFGTVAAGLLGDGLIQPGETLTDAAPRLWIGSAICIGIAVCGTVTALLIRRVPPSQPNLACTFDAWLVPRTTWQILRHDGALVASILASSVFWLVSGIAIQAVNSFGMIQLHCDLTHTSLMTAAIGLGIAVGAVIAGRFSAGQANPKLVRWGLWGIAATLLSLAVSWPVVSVEDVASRESLRAYHHLLGFHGSLPTLALLGASAGFFAIPLQVFIQSRPPEGQKGRMIAFMNLANYIAILLSGVVYGLMDSTVIRFDWPRSAVFGLMALLILPLVIWYHPTFQPQDRRAI